MNNHILFNHEVILDGYPWVETVSIHAVFIYVVKYMIEVPISPEKFFCSYLALFSELAVIAGTRWLFLWIWTGLGCIAIFAQKAFVWFS